LNPEFKKTVSIYEIYPRSKKSSMQKSLHNKTVDILVVDGFIKKIAVSQIQMNRRNKIDNLHVSQGWFDSSVSLVNQVMKKEKPLLMD
jgi:folate-dependent phosphoribosylglycinamide formyltransferase PurN